MRLTTVQVGPLAASSATKISLSQKTNGANALALDGAASTGYSATNIANTQAPGASALTLNGSLAAGSPAIAYVGGQSVVVLSSGNDSAITFTVAGTKISGSGLGGLAYASEVVQGTNASRACTKTLFQTVTSITPSGSVAANASAGTNGLITLDAARQVLFTNGGNDSGITATVTGTDWNGQVVSEVVTQSSGGTATTKYDFLNISSIVLSGAVATTITVGTNGVARSRPIYLDPYALAPTSLQVDVTGTVNYTVQQSLNDPNLVGFTSMGWINHPDTSFVAATASGQSEYGYIPRVTRIVLNSETAGVGNFIVYSILQASGTVM